MNIISLNAWGGKMLEPLTAFIQARKDDTDIFCFQEIFHGAQGKTSRANEYASSAQQDLFKHIASLLPDHIGYFHPTVGDFYGIATFAKKHIDVIASGDISIYENPNFDGSSADHNRRACWLDINLGTSRLSVLNVHGLWNGQGKTDTPHRVEQSKRIRAFMDSVNGPQVVCGDFNLLPDTESLAIVAKDMQDMVKEYNIQTTRTSLYTRADTSGKFADYVFVSPEIKVNDFKVLEEEVSDHAALFVNIEI